jgi:hypothetical protein
VHLNWVDPELFVSRVGYRIAKDSSFGPVAIFAAIDQGKRPPLRSLSELPLEAQRYAALDAWCTLRAWEGWRQQFQVLGGGERISEKLAGSCGVAFAADGLDTAGTTTARDLGVAAGTSGGAGAAGPDEKDPVMAFMERCQRARGTPTFSFQKEGVGFHCSVTVTDGEQIMSGVTVTGCEERTKKQAKKAAATAWMAVACERAAQLQ